MFLPIGDTPNPVGWRPWTNWGLIAANVAVFLLWTWPASGARVALDDPLLHEYLSALREAGVAVNPSQLARWDVLVFAFGYKPGAPGLADLFTSMFMHGGPLHLAGNMLFLWIYGDNVEHRLGRATYLVVYLACGVAATLTFSLLAAGSMIPLVGASGAISGVLGCYFLLFGRNKVKVLIVLFPFIMDVYLIGARWVLGAYVILDNIAPLIFGASSNVAYGAHLGGFFGGLLVAFAGDRIGWSVRRAPTSEAREARRESVATGAHGDQALHRGEKMARLGDPAGAHRVLRAGLRHARGEQRARLLVALGRVHLEHGHTTTAFQHLNDAIDLAPLSSAATEARQLLTRIDVYQRRSR